MSEANTGWIGLGAMGWPMAGHLHAAGHLKAVWNRTLSKSGAFAEQHPDTLAATTLTTLAERCQVIMLCVSADEDLEAVVEELLPALKPGQVLVDHSTVSPATARKLAARLAEHEVGFIDAPVTGGVEGAVKGQLAIMAGGDWDTFQAVQPQLSAYARVTHHLGHAGSGQSAKAVNQLMVSGIAEAVCEALALMDKLDLPREHMLELLSGGAANSWFLEKRGRTMLADEFDVGFAPALLLKDLKICRSLCEEADFDSSVVRQAIADYGQLVAQGEPGKDISALIRLKRQ
ncbi:NAD(P)-dependent oxidoreductase [Wenzhouxiangella limi]|uniref:NAD(P)-dependent oxidoreductase n=1 Tax=Wenzhouxiangella limi TaxID=2707351 RepID=A0A845UYY9_9GAMM|nr:NAD(P)-dependent oxidoreductase [Wenzhouxiangella limi]NDY94286.1 NAD(P)-dependent oxidoreductase [Wenzhouxiangella limi]